MNEAEKDTTVQYTLRMPKSLKEELEKIAVKKDRSLAKQVISALKQYVRDQNQLQ